LQVLLNECSPQKGIANQMDNQLENVFHDGVIGN